MNLRADVLDQASLCVHRIRKTLVSFWSDHETAVRDWGITWRLSDVSVLFSTAVAVYLEFDAQPAEKRP